MDYWPSTVCVDICGCPNACRHCFTLGTPRHERDAEFVSQVYRRFSDHAQRSGLPAPELGLYMQEPFFHTKWREMLALEDELNGFSRRERLRQERCRGLATVGWRIAREQGFAEWLKDYGYEVLQLTFFGLRDTHDWFARREGAFNDLLTTIQRAEESGLVVQPSIMLHKRMIARLPDLLTLLADCGLPHVVNGLRWESLQTIDPTGRGYALEDLRPELADIKSLGPEVIKRIEMPLCPESSYVREALNAPESRPPGLGREVGLTVSINGNVYPDSCWTLDECHCLGNALREDLEAILERFAEAAPPGLHVRAHVGQRELAEQFGDPNGQRVYYSLGQLTERWIRQWCEANKAGDIEDNEEES